MNDVDTIAPDDETGGVTEIRRTNWVAVVKLTVALLLVTLFTIFALQNAASIDVEFLSWSFSMRLILVMLLSAVSGVVAWEIVRLFWRRRRRD